MVTTIGNRLAEFSSRGGSLRRIGAVVKGSALGRLVRYWWHRMRYPDRADFISMGLGIEAREERYRAQWRPHLDLTKSFIEEAVKRYQPSSICILGAGRLYDVPESILTGDYSLTLIDADPGAAVFWPNKSWIRSCVVDISGVLDVWTKLIAQGRSDPEAALRSLPEPKSVAIPRSDLVVSLNLLGQIPVYWQDRVEEILGTALDDSPALKESLRRLEHQHRQELCATKSDTIVLITDDEYYYYAPAIPEFQVEQALQEDPLAMDQYQLVRRSSWWWHLRPAGTEGHPHGEIHRVQALEFRPAPHPISALVQGSNPGRV